ncbi:MAG: His-Xaa-Ser system protein HxsD [Nannocystaceae bacterium]
MGTQLSDIPTGILQAELGQARVSINLDAEVYPLQALYGASYIFIDRCYVFIDRPESNQFRVTLSSKDSEPGEDALRALVGEFANELLSCAWRHQITQDNRTIIETVTMQAIAGAMGEPSLDDLASFDFSDEAFEDPLGIAQSWEDKHGKNVQKQQPEEAAPAEKEAEVAADEEAAS